MLAYCVPILLTISAILFSKLIVCQELQVSQDLMISEHEELFRQLQTENDTIQNQDIKIIFPGTRWCGEGDIAENDEELGLFKETDACCREHDHCADVILVGETKHNFTNNGPFARLSCSCDEQFYKCLSSQCSPIAAVIGITYFDILKLSCFTYNYPANCTEKESHEIIGERCIDYQVNEDEPIWQWREPMKFDKSSKYFIKCFKEMTLEKIKAAKKQILRFVFKYGIEPLIKICNIMSRDSWYRKYFCPKNSTYYNDVNN